MPHIVNANDENNQIHDEEINHNDDRVQVLFDQMFTPEERVAYFAQFEEEEWEAARQALREQALQKVREQARQSVHDKLEQGIVKPAPRKKPDPGKSWGNFLYDGAASALNGVRRFNEAYGTVVYGLGAVATIATYATKKGAAAAVCATETAAAAMATATTAATTAAATVGAAATTVATTASTVATAAAAVAATVNPIAIGVGGAFLVGYGVHRLNHRNDPEPILVPANDTVEIPNRRQAPK